MSGQGQTVLTQHVSDVCALFNSWYGRRRVRRVRRTHASTKPLWLGGLVVPGSYVGEMMERPGWMEEGRSGVRTSCCGG